MLAFLDAGSYDQPKSFNYCLWGRAHIMLKKGDKLVACTRGVESLDEIMTRFVPMQ
ncbi:MAG: hypothetical protein KAW83_04865 [Dehalococcoidia bacterium]|nr:hypothetical protein [Dehalococcoidia bacterium]